MDSLLLNDDLMHLLDSFNRPESHLQVSAGIGNRLFSVHNNSLNSMQTHTKTVYTASIGYFHKSGVSIAGSAYFLKENDEFGITQFAITPGYAGHIGKHIDYSLSYTHFFVKSKFSAYSSPVQDDVYGSILYNKKFIEPGIGVGYSSGQYKETIAIDTVIRNILLHFRDTTTNNLKFFSLTVLLQHDFTWFGVFNKKDGFSFTPGIMLNFGSARIDFTHTSRGLNFLTKRGKVAKFQNNGFKAESLGLNLDLNYIFGKFSVEPQVYLDYYLPETNQEKFSQVYNFTVGYSF